jgi:cell division protein FtsI (penicillin-binding protein 3)
VTDIAERLEDLKDRDLYRRMRLVSGPQGPRVLLDGRPVLLLCSNNYLGLADHPAIVEAAEKAERDFGYGQPTGVGFPGESPGLVNPVQRWHCTDLGVNAIGQGVAVTVLQMASVYATVANGGVLVPPRVVRGTVDPGGRYRPAPAPKPRRVVSAETARALTGILTGVVRKGGTGTLAALGDYTVAGRTGTARKPDPHGRGYLPGAYVASFIGFAPAERPAIVVAVMLDQPKSAIFGGTVAAPAFREVSAYALARLGVLPSTPRR